MAVYLAPIFQGVTLNASGDPASGYKVYTYVAGSSTAQATYTDQTGATPQANPIVLNSRGEPASPIWLTSGIEYKFVLKTDADVDVRTIDDVGGVNDVSAPTQDQWVSGPTPTYVSATQFTLVGDQTTTFHVGRKLKVTDGGGTKYCRITVSAYTTLTTVTVEGDALATPTSAVSYGLVTRADTSTPAMEDDELIVVDPADPTKRIRLDAGNVTAGQTRVLTAPDRDINLGATANAQTGTTYTVVAADYGKVLTFTNAGAITVSLTAAATLGSGFWCWLKNIGTTTVTIDPDGTERIYIPGGANGGDTTVTLPYSGSTTGPYNVSGILLWCDGSNFHVLSTAETHGSELKTSTGSDTWTAPAGVTTVWVTMCAGGGGGGAASAGTNAGGGGGGGESFIRSRRAVVPGTAYTRTVGAAGTGGVNGGAAATAGGNSVFDTLTATGGGAGSADAGGGAGGTGGGGIAGGAGGDGSAAGGISFGTSGGGSVFGAGGAAGVGGSRVGGGFGAGGGGKGNAAGNGAAGTAGFVLIEW